MPDTDLPEIIFGLVGPIGCSIHAVAEALSGALKEVDYTPYIISLSELIRKNLPDDAEARFRSPRKLKDKIEAGNYLRQQFSSNGILAAFAMQSIKETRDIENISRGVETPNVDGVKVELFDVPAPGTAYILNQLKRPEEVELLKKVYGPRFVQVSVTEPLHRRQENLRVRTTVDDPGLADNEIERAVVDLVAIDQDEASNLYGQRITEVFHRGDVFINASDADAMLRTTRRFVHALFGKNEIGPTRDEMGSYHASNISLRSVDMSRQVGAAITTSDGDVLAMGCNDVPKPLGGQYWHEDNHKARDIDRSHEANKAETTRIAYDVLRILHDQGITTEGPDAILNDPKKRAAILDSRIGEITEYGRMVHAEMSALSAASRLGHAVEGATLYVTTFPCHNCAKHIIASGIARVVFIEPYPKSHAVRLFRDAIAQEGEKEKKVSFEHFAGIAPKRFADIFAKGKRRNSSGEAREWYRDRPYPMIPYLDAEYILPENSAIADALSNPLA